MMHLFRRTEWKLSIGLNQQTAGCGNIRDYPTEMISIYSSIQFLNSFESVESVKLEEYDAILLKKLKDALEIKGFNVDYLRSCPPLAESTL